MKVRRPPLWLLSDWIALVGLWTAHMAFAWSFCPVFAEAERTQTRMSPWAVRRFTRIFTLAEAWLAFAINRRAFVLAGLDPAKARFHRPSRPLIREAFLHRLAHYLRHL